MTHLKNIKNILFAFTLLTGFVACNNNKPSETRNIQLLSDSSAYHNNSSTDSAKMTHVNAIPSGNIHHEGNSADSHNSGRAGNTGTVSNVNSSTANTGTVSNSSSSTSTQSSTKKKGWSKGAQDAVIGGAAGAVGGAIISKHKGTGAAIGAAIGAAGGYIIGHDKDKKDGRSN